MVYFYYRKLLRCYLQGCNQLHIEFEFTHASQEDGHNSWHGDMQRDFAESVLRNIPREPIMECLKENGIVGFKPDSHCGMTVTKTDRVEEYQPIYLMDLWFSFSREEDNLRFLANQIIDYVPWQVAKEGIYRGKSYSGDWDFGRQGRKNES